MPNRNLSDIVLSTVVLNWNRGDLLRKTVNSYLATITVPYELFIIDNASSDDSVQFIQEVCSTQANHHAILLQENRGGESINLALECARGELLHISENDLEYLPGWDREVLSKFLAFQDLGQLSLFSPFHEVECGEVWADHPAVRRQEGAAVIYRALDNVGTSCVCRREIWDRGVRWKSTGTKKYWAPDDVTYSKEVKQLGFQVAWNDRYLVFNWGHNASEMAGRLDYYRDNAEGKPYLGFDGLVATLADHGYRVYQDESLKYHLQQVTHPSKSPAAKGTALWRIWMNWLERAVVELAAIIPEGERYLLIDEGLFGPELVQGRTGVSLYESDGTWRGAPGDSADALSRVEPFTSGAVSHIVIMWPSFWWLEYFTELDSRLRDTSFCVLENELVIVFQQLPTARPIDAGLAVLR